MSVIIRLKNLPITAGAPDVRTFFTGLKIPDGAVHIIGGDEGEVFVGFASDEDARIAMQKDRSAIHGAEIRLLLSSKAEQNSVIAARKNGAYSQPKEVYAPPIQSQPPQNQQNWNPQPSGNPYAAKGGYEASYPPQNTNAVRMGYNNVQNNYKNVPEIPKKNHLTSPIKPKEEFGGGGFGAFNQNFPRQGPPAPNKVIPAPQIAKPPVQQIGARVPSNQQQSHLGNQHAQTHPQAHPPIQNQQFPPERQSQFPVKGVNNSEPTNNFQAPPVHERPSGGDSWRDTSYNQPSRNGFKDDYGDYNEDYKPQDFKPDFKQDFNGAKPQFNQQAPPRAAPEPQYSADASLQNGRKTLMPTPTTFQNAPVLNNNAPMFPPLNPQRNGPAPFNTGLAPALVPNHLPAQIPNRLPAPFQNPMIPVAAFSQPVAPIIPSAPALSAEKFYIELTRLPNELLRPANLEKFIDPSTPLTLSSVKTVFGPGGIHMNTIIRFDSIGDYAKMMRRNGEMGIKIQKSDKKTFELAIDGVPMTPVVTPPKPQLSDSKEDDSKKGKRSRWGDDRRSPRRSPPRRDRRDRSRSRSPPRRRRRSRSPKRREEHTDPTRWCVQVTNVPFRIKEEDLLEWFSEKVRPAKLTRTFYSDGNASDRWIAEFSSESLMHRSFSIRTLCSSRQLQLKYIDNEKADEILKIVDVYGEEKKTKNEFARMQAAETEMNNPPSFFNGPPGRGPPGMQPNGPPMGPPNGMPMPNGMNGGMNGGPPNGFNGPPMRGGFAPRGGNGGGFGPPSRGGGRGCGPGGPPGQGFYQNGFNGGPDGPPFGNQGPSDMFNQAPDSFGRGSFRGGFRGRGGGPPRGGFHDVQPSRNEFMELVNSIGPPGTVLSCTGFPNDVTLEDVVEFFINYQPDRNSIRIRRGEDGVMTGECMLACFSPESSHQASMDLDGRSLRNSVISVRVV